MVCFRRRQSFWVLSLFTALSAFADDAAKSPAPEKNSKPSAASSTGSAKEEKTTAKQRTLGILLYEKFELLDVAGPAEVFGNIRPDLKVVMVAEKKGPVASTQGTKMIADYDLASCPELDLILVPGGVGTLRQISNKPVLEWLRMRSEKAELVMSVCSGSAILAKAGVLDGRKATTNKIAFKRIKTVAPKTNWVKEARWVEDGKFVTSSGVSAGIDMALAVVKKLWGEKAAESMAVGMEYDWHRDASWDPFAKLAP